MQQPRSLVWLGDSRKTMREFPKQARTDIGTALFVAQCGEKSDAAKPFKGVGSGVFEIVERHDKNAFRLIYAVQLGKKIYVLHAFQKKSKSGIATPKKDVDLIKQRYREAQERAKNEA